ncbi:protocadherin Fat 1-like [Diadema antillarum]|uniref:protocadherin Fat 1-like n=1 Tax=Diadema antillarum TaxID=105358 RepID=UPI003A882567
MAGMRWDLQKLGAAPVTMVAVLLLFLLQLGCSVVSGQQFKFTRPLYNATIEENSPIRTYISSEQKMGIYLSNMSMGIRYTLLTSDVRDLFIAKTEVVGDFAFLRIRIKPCNRGGQCPNLRVNREVRGEYDLSVRAESRIGGKRVVDTTDIHLVVKDVNEQPPLFLRGSYDATIREDHPVFSNIIQVEAHDSDSGTNGEVYYSFSQQTDQFAIHTTTGVVSLTRPLDYYHQSEYRLTVVAKDRGFTPYGGAAHTTRVPLVIRVTQVNMHPPVISVEKQPTISLNSEVGTVFAVVYVNDEDPGENGEISSLNIIEGNPEGFFEIVPTRTRGRYQMQIVRSLLLTRLPPSVNVTVAATDSGQPPRSSSKVISVLLDGVMDFESYFTRALFNTTISELMPVNTPFLSLAPRNAAANMGVFYVITDPSVPFSVGPHTGTLSVAVDLDRETKADYSFRVVARNAKQQTIVETDVLIHLSDANDNNPVFDEDFYVVNVEENHPANYPVIKVNASDPDLGENGFISYSIANMNPVPFTIDHQTGYINTSKVLDYETMRHQYRLRVRASDWGSPFRREAEVEVTINLINVNDNRPKFEKINCVGAIARSFPPGRAIALISALDFDENRPRYRITRGNVNDLFSLNPSSGNLTLSRRVEDSDPIFYSLKIEARDGSNSVSYMRTNMTITNTANPNPQAHARGLKVTCQETSVAEEIVELFEQLQRSNQEVEHLPPNYAALYSANLHEPEFDARFRSSVVVPEDAPVGSTILTVYASDVDHGFNGKLVYAISAGNEQSHFQMDFETGELKVLTPLDRETQSVYELTVKVSDMGSPQHTKKRALTITLADVNDNPPQFDLSGDMYEVTIPEDAEEGLVFLAVHASDRDEGRNQEVRYSIISDSPAFDIDVVSGDLRVAGLLDREQQPVHEVRVQASDLSDTPLASSVIVRITLADINDNPPCCLLPEYKVKVREDLPTGAAVLTVQAHDPDNPPNGTVHYRLDVLGPSKFSIDTDYGTLRLIEMLDYEDTQLYEIQVAIRDEGIPAMSSTCKIVVEVIDVNENIHAPVFENYVLTGSVHEGRINNTEVMTITATDMDMGMDGEVFYTIRDGSGLGRFSIDGSGVIRTTEELDRESIPYYWLTVYAQDRGAIPLHSVVQVFIEVLDINDNPPLPTLPVFRASIPENSPMGVSVVTIEAVDPDISSQGNLTFAIKTRSARKYFAIDERTGVITTAGKVIDREKKGSELDFEVQISDNGQPPLKSIAKVAIAIEDENDNDPLFVDGKSISVRVPAIEAPDERYFIYRMMATDKDIGSNAQLSFFLREGNTGSRFYIDATTGEVTCSKTLSVGEDYVLQIEVKDNGPIERQFSLTRLAIYVVAAQEPSPHAPIFDLFDDGDSEINIPENDPVGEFLLLASAIDYDNDELRYTIQGGNDDGAFFLHPGTGSLYIAEPLDSETKSTYDLVIEVSDGFNTDTLPVHINVIDINDNPPVLEQEVYEVDIPENTHVGTPLLQVVATDRDATDRIFYTLPTTTADPASRYKFRIDTSSGVIVLNESLDHESQRRHVLTVEVKDYNLGVHRTYARVVVNVLDSNDHVPEFSAESYEGKVYETAAVGTRVVDVYAFDRDQGSNAELTYSIVQGNTGQAFDIDPILGTVTVGHELNIEEEAQYSLVVRATDHGEQPLSNVCFVNVSVTLSNNAPPRFREPEYIAEVLENRPGNQFVMQISTLSRSSVYYEITKGNEAGRFSINPNSGIVTAMVSLDYEDVTMYNLTVQATNMVGLRTNACMVIHVQDVNDNAPQFTSSEYIGSISESASLQSVVLDSNNHPLVISALDEDSGHNAHLVYEIIERDAQMYFSIDESTGAIRTKMSLDHENIPEFEFTVQVHDTGSPQMMAEKPARVRITIIDINDSQPRFIQEIFEATLLLPTYTGVFVLKVTAVDEDEVSLSQLEYSIHEGDRSGRFSINAQSGDIFVANGTDLSTEYDITVRVSDGLNFNDAHVHVHIASRPTSSLRFPANECYAIIRENSSTVHDVAVLSVIGNTLNEPLHYSILNPSPMFSIRPTSGIVRNTGIPFDRELQDSYHIVVEARDSRTPPRVAHIIVNVEILDVNDNTPIFVHHQYDAIVQVDAGVGEQVRQVTAIDRDIGKNGEVQYTLVDGGEGHFAIDSSTGVIVVRERLGASSQNKNFTLKIKASDKGKPNHSVVVDVPITVRNKAMPVFEEQYYRASIPEDLELHSAVRQIQAISPHGRDLIYSIGEGDPFNQFDINPSTGVINLIGAVDYETQNQYSLQVLASDTLTGASAMVTVDIDITDVNDVAPSFNQKIYQAVLSEAVAVGSTVLQVSSTDQDSPENSGVRYQIVQTDNRTSFFHIAANSGLILTSHVLDYEERRTHDFLVVATDSGMPPLQSETHVSIRVTDMNDNPPHFVSRDYYCAISELAERGAFVTAVSAIDPDISDVDKLTYSIVTGNEDMTFVINKKTGVINLSTSHKPNLVNGRGFHQLNVSVSDQVFTSSATVHVNITRVNRHTPVFSLDEYITDFMENTTAGEVVYQVMATDEDTGIFGEVMYSIMSAEARRMFDIDSQKGEIRSRTLLDLESVSERMLRVPVMAVDGGGKTAYTTVQVILNDRNDNPPRFEMKEYRAFISADAELNTAVVVVAATDGDSGSNSLLTYSFSNGTDATTSDLFQIDAKTGTISTKESLQGEEGSTFRFFVMAEDGGNPSLSWVTAAEIYVMSSDDEQPVFDDEWNPPTIDVAEDVPVGTFLASFNAHSNASVTYSLVPGNDEHTNEPTRFSIDEQGNLTLVSSLDFESVAWYKLIVKATTTTEPPIAAYSTVLVTVTDVNDNVPIFEDASYNVKVPENTPVDEPILRVMAMDADSDPNSQVVFSLGENDDDVFEKFKVHDTTGVVTLREALDREMTITYDVVIQAMDAADSDFTATTTVHVTVMDFNDSPPRFTKKLYTGEVLENSSQGTVAISVQAIDSDVGANARIVYYITSGDPYNHFAIESNSGTIYVANQLDREVKDSYRLNVTATDGLFADTTQVVITVTDINDNSPVCLQTLYTENIRENLPVGHYILHVTATDADIGSNAEITYTLEGEGSELFTIEKDPGEGTGIVRTLGELDYEINRFYRFRVIATDGGGLSCSTGISIGLLDENDNPPIFSQLVYNVSVSENTTVSTLLTRVQAIDPDSGANRRHYFTVTDHREENVFSLDSESGILTLVQSLDRENRSQYNLTLVAIDALLSDLTSSAQLIVNVLDENDNEPQFESDLYNATISEDAPVGSTVATVLALSQDVGLNAQITYQIVSGNEHGKFRIDSDIGEITVAAALDYEMSSTYYLTVKASDMGTNPLSDSTTINIYITDANDNAPRFSRDIYSTNVNEAARVGGDVVQVMATDADSGVNGHVIYSIIDGNLFDQFTINPNNGLVSLAAKLDREQISSYSLLVRATDLGEEPQHTDVTVKVTIDDINDNPPFLLQQNYTIRLQEDTAVDSPLLALNATDLDTPANGAPFTFQIVRGNENGEFSMIGSNVLRNRISFNRDVESQYNLTIEVSDSGRPVLSSLAFVTVVVVNQMNMPQVISPLTITISSFLDTFPGGYIGEVAATDKDPYDILTFGVVSDNLFRIGEKDGHIIAMPDLDEGYYPVNVSISDGHFTVYANVQVTVQQLDQAMLNNSVTITFADTTPVDFLPNQAIFKYTVANQFLAIPEDVIVITIHESVENRANTDVVFAIQRRRQRGSYLKPKQIQRQMGDLSNALNDRMKLEVVSWVSDMCTPQSCELHYACETTVTVNYSTVSTFSTPDKSFVSSRHHRDYVCICQTDSCVSTTKRPPATPKPRPTTIAERTPGPIKQPCASNPCHVNMRCEDVGRSDYICTCQDNSHSCFPSVDEPMSFNGESFITYTALDLSTSSTQLLTSIRTDRSDGIIMYGAGPDVSVLEIIGGQLTYRFDCGSGEATVRLTQKKVNDHMWHKVSVRRDNNHAVLTLDDQYSAEGTAPGDNRDLNLQEITIGARPPSNRGSHGRMRRSVEQGFSGCMGGTRLNGEPLPVLGDAVSPHNVGKCSPNLLPHCQNNPCKNGGSCFDLGYSFSCQCPPNWMGDDCSVAKDCTSAGPGADVSCIDPAIPQIETGFPMKLIIIIISVILVIIVVVLVIAACRYHRKKRRSRYPPDGRVASRTYGEDFKRSSKLSDEYPSVTYPMNPISEPSPTPPPLPTRPTSYTRSNHNSLNNLDRDRHDDIQPYHGQPISQQPSLPPVPSNSASDSDSIAKPTWEFDAPSTHNSCIDGRDSNKGLSPHPLQHSQPSILPPIRRNIPPLSMAHPPSESPPAYRRVAHPQTDMVSMSSVNTEDEDGLRGYNWDCSDWMQLPEGFQSIPERPPRHPRDSPTNISTNTSNVDNDDEDDYETEDDDEYVGGDDTDYPPENEDMPCARATREFRQQLANYPPPVEDYESLPLEAYQINASHYLPAHSISTSEIPPDYDNGSPDQSSMSCAAPPRHLPLRPANFQRPISDISQDALSMSMYTSTNASCSDVSGMCEPDSEINLSEYGEIEECLTNLQTSTDV